MAISNKVSFGGKESAPSSLKDIMKSASGNSEKIKQISIQKLQSYPNQPFKMYTPDRMELLKEDLEINGILSPIIVRPLQEDFQILAGHNRVKAAKELGWTEVPCIVKDLNDEEASLIVVNTNLNQREKLLPSEKAFAYKIQMDAMKKLDKVGTAQKIGDHAGESRRQVERYVRLTYLQPTFLEWIDEGKLGMVTGVNLSFIPFEKQQSLFDYLKENNIFSITLVQSEQLKKLDSFHTQELNGIFEKKAQTKKEVRWNKTMNVIKTVFSTYDVTDQQAAEIVQKALDDYYKEKSK